MSDTSTHLALPYLAPSQAQKHVTHNEALQILDAIVQLSVASRTKTAPPNDPETGARYIVPALASGVWAGLDDQVAAWTGTAWIYLEPQSGWRAWVEGEDAEVIWRNGVWQHMAGLDGIETLGVNTSPDVVNRLAVASDATLFSHDGASHQLKVNKATSVDTASLLFQSNWSGRAEMGLTGNDAWSIKVSPDGAVWNEALTFNSVTGLASGQAVQSHATDATSGRLLSVGAFGLGGDNISISASSLDGVDAIGFYVLSDAVPGILDAGTNILHTQSNIGQGVQIAFQSDADAIKWRRKSSGIWQDWQNIFSNTNILGPVAETGGVPTGALFERGSNADGEYTRFADGTLICKANLTLMQTADDRVQVEWTYPASFVANSKPTISGLMNITDSSITPNYSEVTGPFTALHGKSSTRISYRRIPGSVAFDVNDTVQMHATGIGRWF